MPVILIQVAGHDFEVDDNGGNVPIHPIHCAYYNPASEVRCEHRLIPDASVSPGQVMPGTDEHSWRINPSTLAHFDSLSDAEKKQISIPTCEFRAKRAQDQANRLGADLKSR